MKPTEILRTIIIDDDFVYTKLLQKRLSSVNNVEVIGAYANPVEGLMACAKYKPDLLFLDYRMPYLDGSEVLDFITPKPKIILMSSHHLEVDLKARSDAFMCKKNVVSDEGFIITVLQKVLNNTNLFKQKYYG